MSKLDSIVDALASGKSLSEEHRNHFLKGKLIEFEECHINDDWVLVYQKRNDLLVLVLIRTGTHNSVFGD